MAQLVALIFFIGWLSGLLPVVSWCCAGVNFEIRNRVTDRDWRNSKAGSTATPMSQLRAVRIYKAIAANKESVARRLKADVSEQQYPPRGAAVRGGPSRVTPAAARALSTVSAYHGSCHV